MFSNFGPFSTRGFFVVFRKMFLKVFWNSEWVAKTQGTKKMFFGCLLSFFGGVFFHVVSLCSRFVIMCLLLCECVIHPCILSFVVMFFFFAVVVFHCFFPALSLLCYVCFILLFFVSAFSLLKTQTKSQNAPISEILFLMFCFGACILTLPLGPANNPYSAQWTTPQNGIC